MRAEESAEYADGRFMFVPDWLFFGTAQGTKDEKNTDQLTTSCNEGVHELSAQLVDFDMGEYEGVKSESRIVCVSTTQGDLTENHQQHMVLRSEEVRYGHALGQTEVKKPVVRLRQTGFGRE
ncbi:hypothetical protein T265_02817 [Opisthorchis viverrini]|uniref:Uncharacterized protein n=1 Tax=Opisthorchis viverrini TaxID=6198 RepID=A0A075A5A8_OPIVI|nr:hypothetical protein T265_02817 [Opisthorchis viverrini]KER30775.1 hypothetical protein T265_02817 [Opisthorchis viverrini]